MAGVTGERRSYCRYCYAPLEGFRGRPFACPACGATHTRELERKYWSREPGLVRLERTLFVGAVLVAFAVSAWLWVKGSAKASLGMGPMYAVLTGLTVFGLLWLTLRKLTGRPTSFRAGLLWTVILPLVGISLGFLAYEARASSTLLAGLYGGAGLAALALGPVAWKSTAWHRDWRTKRIESSR